MKKLIVALLLTTAAATAPAYADVGISLRIGEPGFYGQLDIGDFFAPRVIYSQPVIVVERHRHVAPIYLRVPREHSRNWRRYCGRYDACARPVYFVRDEWYSDVYVPRYRQTRTLGWREHRHNGRYDYRDDRGDRRAHRGDRNDRRAWDSKRRDRREGWR